MTTRHAGPSDLPTIVSIYNAAIQGWMATADLLPVSVAGRERWFADFDPDRRLLWVLLQRRSGPTRPRDFRCAALWAGSL